MEVIGRTSWFLNTCLRRRAPLRICLFHSGRDEGVHGGLPGQRAPQAMDGAGRMVFMEELARADAELGKNQFRAMLEQWRSRWEGQAPERVR